MQKRHKRFSERIRKNPPLLFLFGYGLVILVGTLLLMTPWATSDGHIAPFIDALFVSTSAVCVTGLTPVVTATYMRMEL